MSDPVTPYQMTINNCIAFMKRDADTHPLARSGITAFQISEILAIAFCTSKEQVMSDLLKVYTSA